MPLDVNQSTIELRQQVELLHIQLELQRQEYTKNIQQIQRFQTFLQQVADECAIALRQSQLNTRTKIQAKQIKKKERQQQEFIKHIAYELRKPITIDFTAWLCAIVASFRDVTTCQQQHLHLYIPPAIPPISTDINDLEKLLLSS